MADAKANLFAMPRVDAYTLLIENFCPQSSTTSLLLQELTLQLLSSSRLVRHRYDRRDWSLLCNSIFGCWRELVKTTMPFAFVRVLGKGVGAVGSFVDTMKKADSSQRRARCFDFAGVNLAKVCLKDVEKDNSVTFLRSCLVSSLQRL